MNVTITNSGESIFFNVDGISTSWQKGGIRTNVHPNGDGTFNFVMSSIGEPGDVMSFPYSAVTLPVSANVYDLQNQVEAFLDSGGSVTIGMLSGVSGTETFTASVVTDSTASPVVAGKKAITFTTSSTFAGTILGVTRNASTIYSFSPNNPSTVLAEIAYTVTAGSMTIDVSI